MAPRSKSVDDSKETVRSRKKTRMKLKLSPRCILSPKNTMACSEDAEMKSCLGEEKIPISLSSCRDIATHLPEHRQKSPVKKAVPLKKRRVDESVLMACAQQAKLSPRPSMSNSAGTSHHLPLHSNSDQSIGAPRISSNEMLVQDALTNYIVTAAVRALERSNGAPTQSLSNTTMGTLSLYGNYPSRRTSLLAHYGTSPYGPLSGTGNYTYTNSNSAP